MDAATSSIYLPLTADCAMSLTSRGYSSTRVLGNLRYPRAGNAASGPTQHSHTVTPAHDATDHSDELGRDSCETTVSGPLLGFVIDTVPLEQLVEPQPAGSSTPSLRPKPTDFHHTQKPTWLGKPSSHFLSRKAMPLPSRRPLSDIAYGMPRDKQTRRGNELRSRERGFKLKATG